MPRNTRSCLLAWASATTLAIAVSVPLHAAEPVTPKLTEKLDRLLREEMRSVQAAMGQIHSAMVMGEHAAVAEAAQRVHDSFILQQSLTDEDRRDLKAAVPPGFIQLDREFHELSANLADAGRSEDTASQFRVYNRMTRNCIQCHARYVSDRFPGVEQLGDGDRGSSASE
ncbi:hypothetical protein [Arhodomonas sp. SL1]|uniref:hypothetical protein n=1 Tax=Arhodomonas sp. SL1 TaxID=3425691 RepID=UPI003F88095B